MGYPSVPTRVWDPYGLPLAVLCGGQPRQWGQGTFAGADEKPGMAGITSQQQQQQYSTSQQLRKSASQIMVYNLSASR